MEKRELTNSQKNIIQAMILAGSSEEAAIEATMCFGKKGVKQTDTNSLSCPRCKSTMKIVALADNRPVRYCTNDRITLPLKLKRKTK